MALSESTASGWLVGLIKVVFWLLVIVFLISQVTGPDRYDEARKTLINELQQARQSRVVALIHREETVSVLGVPVDKYISIEDSESILRVIRRTPDKQPIDIILHTPGGLVLASSQIAKALADHQGKVTAFVPHYAMSGGTLIALAADEVVMDRHAVLGPVDPQLGNLPAGSILKLLELKKMSEISDVMLIMADQAEKARTQVFDFVKQLLIKKMSPKEAERIAGMLSEGRWTHDYPITVDIAQSLGIKINTDMPETVYQMMDLYPQAGNVRPSVLYVPMAAE